MMTTNNIETNADQGQHGAVFNQRVRADDRLDALYMREMRCPYCQTRIPRGTAKCKNCALTKEQIYFAKLTVPYKPGRNILMSKVRPAELSYGQMVAGAIFGFLGIHCFIAKRYLRGALILFLTIAFIALSIAFPATFGDAEPNNVRYMFESKTYLFPGDLLGILALGLWVWDLFAVIFGQFKYPIVVKLGENDGRN